MPKECKNCVHKSNFKSAECGVCMVSYYDGEQIGLPSNFEQKPQTNADRIRAMSDEELAEGLDSLRYGFGCELCEKVFRGCDENCRTHFMEWLKQPAEEE